ncbi:MAG: hypothetical protein ABIT05_03990 [Chitinophagaceae bacterium]
MNRFLFFLLVLFISQTCIAGELSDTCHHFKTGKFSYRDSSGIITSITRTKKQQTEINSKTGLLTKSKISWVGECEYRLTQTWANSKEGRKNNRRQITINITRIAGNSYEYACSCNDKANTTIQGVVVKLSD